MILTKEDISQIIDILKTAGKVVMELYQNADDPIQIQYKSDNSPVTLADSRANEIICDYLTLKYPDIPIISEEAELASYEERKNWEYLWLVDPLDGTKEFLNKTDEFSINLALVKNQHVVAGFIFLPVFSLMYYALKEGGAFEIDSDGHGRQLKSSSFRFNQSGLKVVSSRSYRDEKTQTYINKLKDPYIIKLGSALKFVSIAKGDADYYPRMINIMEWDTAAGQIIIEEAGGSLLEANTGKPLVYNKPSMTNPFFIAAGNIID